MRSWLLALGVLALLVIRRHVKGIVMSALLLAVGVGCGPAPDHEQDTNADEEAEGVICDRFELRWELDGTDLLLAIDTDLPGEGELAVSVRRTYFEVGSDDAYARDYFSEFEPVSRWRLPRRIALHADAWKADLAAHQDEMAGLGTDLAFEVDRIADSIGIRAVLHVNQDDPRFGGRGNPNLTGEATSRRGDSNLVEAEASVEFPLDGPPPARISNRVPYDGLAEGELYRLSGKTPSMPELESADPLQALAGIRELPAGSVIQVRTTAAHQGQAWYEVALVEDESTTGWL